MKEIIIRSACCLFGLIIAMVAWGFDPNSIPFWRWVMGVVSIYGFEMIGRGLNWREDP